MHPELEKYRQEFELISTQAQELSLGLTEAQFNWRPSPDQWSIEECISHLTMVGQVELLAIEAAIDHARIAGTRTAGLHNGKNFEYPAWERFILRETEPPVRHAMSAPKRFVPLHGQPITGVLPTFLHVQRNFGIQIARADGLDLRRVKVPTPIVPLIKLSLGATLAQAAAHERRHLWQARRVRDRIK